MPSKVNQFGWIQKCDIGSLNRFCHCLQGLWFNFADLLAVVLINKANMADFSAIYPMA
jgi:hypothetical protein